MEERSVKVFDLKGHVRLVGGIKWDTTVQELLCKLYPSTAATTDSDDQGHKRHVAGEDLCLLEAWKGCISCLPSHKRISSTLGEWGYLPDREELVNLVVMKKSRMLAYQTSKELVKSRRYHCGKISQKKHSHHRRYHLRGGRSKQAMVKYIKRIAEELEAKTKDVHDLLTPKKLEELPGVDIAALPEEQRKEGQGLLEAIAEEEKEKEGFQQRKNELTDKITSQQIDVVQLQDEVSSYEAKVLNEQHKLSNLLEVRGLPEIEEIHKETARVKGELKVRTKLNRLQSTKMQELTGTVLQVEEELKACLQEIELLKLSTPL